MPTPATTAEEGRAERLFAPVQQEKSQLPTSTLEAVASEAFRPFLSTGTVTSGGETVPVRILRDTGALQTLIRGGPGSH